jgi:tRNA modification GTPase
MLPRHDQPIVAIATAPGRGAVGIVRVSGADISDVIQAVCGQPLKPRHATFLPFIGHAGVTLDEGLALHFPAPASYTGEDVLELQAHGGPVVLQLLLARCLQAGKGIGLRLANPGEFTERAFLNGKLDLTQAEAVADLIEASTEAAARSAVESLGGAFSREVDALRVRVERLRTLVEATLDFPEEDIDFLEQADARGQLRAIQANLQTVLERARQGALLREGIKVVLAGQPNVGKSSLLNALAGAELAIVTPIPGTTRDKVSQTIQIEGVPLHIVDTAGLREAGDEVERIGVERSWQAIESADAVIFLHDLTRRGEADYDAAEARIAHQLGLPDALATQPRILHVYNKADVVATATEPLSLSAHTGDGLDALRTALLAKVGWHAAPEGVFIARARHLDALRRIDQHLAQAAAFVNEAASPLDLLAEELRLAHLSLSEITGVFTADDLLGKIFGSFCIGK